MESKSMYKKQMLLQKIICILSVIAAALTFLYSLGIMTDLFDSLFSTMRAGDDPNQNFVVPGAYVYYEMQEFNRKFVKGSIILIIISLMFFVTNTNTRRRYYIANYAIVIVNAVYTTLFTIWNGSEISKFKEKFLQVDFKALKEYSENWGTLYTESTFWFDVHYVVFGILMVLAVLHIINLLWKRSLMRNEEILIGARRENA